MVTSLGYGVEDGEILTMGGLEDVITYEICELFGSVPEEVRTVLSGYAPEELFLDGCKSDVFKIIEANAAGYCKSPEWTERCERIEKLYNCKSELQAGHLIEASELAKQAGYSLSKDLVKNTDAHDPYFVVEI